MFVVRWWRFLKGYLVLNLRGRGVERLLNLAMVRGIRFWDLRRFENGAQLKASLSTFRQLRSLVRKSHCRIHIAGRAGLPFWMKRLHRHRGLAAGAIFFCIALYLFSSFIWSIRITGCGSIPVGEVKILLEQMGVRPGIWKGSLDLYDLEEELARLHPGISWAGFLLRGTLLEIEIVEHLMEPPYDNRPGDLVAGKDGLVVRVLTVEGDPAVEPGATVLQGDLLIRGMRVTRVPGDGGKVEEILEPVSARGTVEARVWYEARAPIKNNITVTVETGHTRERWYLTWSSGNLLLWGSRRDPFALSRREVVHRLFRWRNLTIPVELIYEICYELLHQEIELDPGEALRLARREALHRVKAQLPEGISAGQPFFEEYTHMGKQWILVVLETKENIAVFRPQQPD